MGLSPGNALITGAGKRLGRAMALELGALGWNVAVHYNGSADAAEETAREVEALGGLTCTLGADLLVEAETQALVGRAADGLGGPLTLLVNNASIFEHDTIETADRESWDRHMESNLRAPFVLTQNFAAQAPEAAVDAEGLPHATGCIVNMVDQRVRKLTPHFMSYTIAKMGLWALTRTSAQALAPRIRVNAIGPGPTMQGARQTEEHFAQQRAATLLERGAAPADIVAGLRYILSADALTGQMIALDGGQHLGWRTPDVIGIE